MQITLNFEGAGWAFPIFEINGTVIEMNVSYLSDFLDDLLYACCELSEMARSENNESTCYFECYDEPGVYEWEFKRTTENILKVKVIFYEDRFWKPIHGHEASETERKTEKAFECNWNEFLNTLLTAVEIELKRSGIMGYRYNWQHAEFPFAKYLKLKLFTEAKNENIEVNDTHFSSSNLAEELKILMKLVE